jgi:hypothetical protein
MGRAGEGDGPSDVGKRLSRMATAVIVVIRYEANKCQGLGSGTQGTPIDKDGGA